MEEKRVLSIVFPTEFILKENENLVLIRHTNGQPLRMCKPDELQQNFAELLDEVRESVAIKSAAGKSAV